MNLGAAAATTTMFVKFKKFESHRITKGPTLSAGIFGDKRKPEKMLLVSQAASGGLSGRACCSFRPPPKFSNPKPTLYSNRKSPRRTLHITLAKADGGLESTPATKQIPSDSNPSLPLNNNPTVFVGQESVPLEGVIQFEKPNATASRLDKWGWVANSNSFSMSRYVYMSIIHVFNFRVYQSSGPASRRGCVGVNFVLCNWKIQPWVLCH